eukprot:4534224-Alexandrium_andersonii.AAC.1
MRELVVRRLPVEDLVRAEHAHHQGRVHEGAPALRHPRGARLVDEAEDAAQRGRDPRPPELVQPARLVQLLPHVRERVVDGEAHGPAPVDTGQQAKRLSVRALVPVSWDGR